MQNRCGLRTQIERSEDDGIVSCESRDIPCITLRRTGFDVRSGRSGPEAPVRKRCGFEEIAAGAPLPSVGPRRESALFGGSPLSRTTRSKGRTDLYT